RAGAPRPLRPSPTRRSSDLLRQRLDARGVDRQRAAPPPALEAGRCQRVRLPARGVAHPRRIDQQGDADVAPRLSALAVELRVDLDRKSTRLNSSHVNSSYAV